MAAHFRWRTGVPCVAPAVRDGTAVVCEPGAFDLEPWLATWRPLVTGWRPAGDRLARPTADWRPAAGDHTGDHCALATTTGDQWSPVPVRASELQLATADDRWRPLATLPPLADLATAGNESGTVDRTKRLVRDVDASPSHLRNLGGVGCSGITIVG
eukprot:5632044-Prymnesium_polylepis.2